MTVSGRVEQKSTPLSDISRGSWWRATWKISPLAKVVWDPVCFCPIASGYDFQETIRSQSYCKLLSSPNTWVSKDWGHSQKVKVPLGLNEVSYQQYWVHGSLTLRDEKWMCFLADEESRFLCHFCCHSPPKLPVEFYWLNSAILRAMPEWDKGVGEWIITDRTFLWEWGDGDRVRGPRAVSWVLFVPWMLQAHFPVFQGTQLMSVRSSSEKSSV